MAYTSIDNPELYFQVKTYSGTDASPQAFTLDGDEDMQPDMVWIKNRGYANKHVLFDSVRGVNKSVTSDSNAAEVDQNSDGGYVSAFGSDGFTLTEGSSSDNDTNDDRYTYVAWCWKAGTTSSLSGGDITPSPYSYNATSGFGIYKYTGNGSTDQEIPHGLGKKPQMIFFKRLDSSTNWVVQSNLLGNRVQLVINDTTAQNTDSRLGASDDWSTTIFNVGTYGDMNSSGDPHVAYAFCNIQGYSKIGTYTGNGDNDSPFIYLGFRPAFIIVKNIDSGTPDWVCWDNKRNGRNTDDNEKLYPNSTNAEANISEIDLLSNGFKLRSGGTENNTSGEKYIYIAWAEAPFVNSNGVPCNAR